MNSKTQLVPEFSFRKLQTSITYYTLHTVAAMAEVCTLSYSEELLLGWLPIQALHFPACLAADVIT